METEDTTQENSRTVPLVCTAPSRCASNTFEVKDDRANEVLKLTCVKCGHEQTWKLSEDQ